MIPLHRLWRTLVILALLLAGTAGVTLAQPQPGTVGVYYVGPEDAIAGAIDAASPYLFRVDQPELAQVLVINDAPLTQETLLLFGKQIQQGDVGLVLFAGPQFPRSPEELGALMGVATFGMQRSTQPLPLEPAETSDPLQRAVAWQSAPPLHARTVISNPNLLQPIVVTSAREPVLQQVRGREERPAFVFGGWIDHESNAAWLNWPYYDYLVYRLVAEAGGVNRTFSFAAYPYAPVPRGFVKGVILGMAVGSLLVAVGVLFFARRHVFLHSQIFGTEQPFEGPTVPESDWDQVGFHRPLAGFLYRLILGLLSFAPLLAYSSYVIPRYLIPWPQTLSFWEMLAQWFGIAWLVFDLGTGIAAVRFFATLRVRFPQEAFRYFQFYVWWQIISGAIQFGLLAGAAGLVLPTTPLAHLSLYVVAHALVQFPGFLAVMGLFFRSVQRFDHEQHVATLLLLGTPLLQVIAVLLLRRLGPAIPTMTEALGGVVGLGLGIYLARWLAFGAGLWLYNREGHALRVLLLPAFTRRITGRMLGFGARLTFGTLAVPVSYLLQVFLLPDLLPENGLGRALAVAYLFAGVFALFLDSFYDSLLPAMAEAYTQGYETLTRYYVSEGFRYGGWLSAFLLAVIAGAGNAAARAILGDAGALTARLLGPMLVWGALAWPAWNLERLLVAAGRPALRSWLLLAAHAMRLGLLVVLVPRWPVGGLIAAHLASRIFHVVAAWFAAYRWVLAPRLYLWQTLVVPAGSAFILYDLLRLVITLLASSAVGGSVVMVIAALVITLPLYTFLTALLGGWDDGGIAELARASRLSGPGYLPAQLLLWILRWGARLSPLHGRYPVALRSHVEEETHALTLGRSPMP